MDPGKRKQNLEGLLRLAVENSGQGELEPESNPCETNNKRTEFLQSALSSLTDPNNETEFALAKLRSDSVSIAEKIDCLDLIRSCIDDIDNANSFVKVGGITLLLEYIREPDVNLRPQSICIVAEMAQNNEFCQNYFLTEDLIPLLISTMNHTDEAVAKGSVYAISSLIQNFRPGLNEFLRKDGFNALLSCLKSTHNSVYIKTAFLIGALSLNESAVREIINKQNAAEILLSNVENKDAYDHKLEATLRALSALSVNSKWSITNKQNAEAEQKLKQIINNKSLEESSEDFANFARIILKSGTFKKN